MTDWEEITCQAERDYDFMREEQLLMSKLTPDDHWDNSRWHDFIKTDVEYWSKAMLEKAIKDLKEEKDKRK